MNNDIVNHPKHYVTSSMECIDVMIATYGVEMVTDYCIVNAFKYRWRFKEKNGIEDLKKALWYINKTAELLDVYQWPDKAEKWFLYNNIRSSVLAAIQEEASNDEG